MNKNNNKSINDFHIPRWKELPNVELYIEQVVKFINSCLSPYLFYNADDNSNTELLTKSMINNYVKNSIIESPTKKQYSKNQIAKLFVICVLKQVYSIHEIDYLIEFALKGSTLENAYDKFCNLFEEALRCTFNREDFIDKDAQNDNLYLLKSTLLSCSYKIYVQNNTFK